MASKPPASGSIWNVNSWHWQMKNYTDVAKKLIDEKLKNLVLKDKEITINTLKIKFSKAEAEVNIRKGKQYLVYDFDIDVDYRAEDEAHQIQGSYHVKEINHDDLEDIIVEDIKTNDKNEISDRVKNFLKKNLKTEYIKLFKTFGEDLAKFQADPTKLQQDKKKRQEAMIATQKAREEKGEEKQRLLQEQKQKEKKMKQQFSKWGSQK